MFLNIILLRAWLTATACHHQTHVFSGSPMIGWQKEPPLPVHPEARQQRKPPVITYREAATFGSLIPHMFSCCIVVGWQPFFDAVIPTCSHAAL